MKFGMYYSLSVTVLLVIIYSQPSECLQCYKCINSEVVSGSSLLRKSFQEKSDPDCAKATFGSNVETTECRDGDLCGLVESSATVSYLVGKLNVKIQSRGCMTPPEEITLPKCYDDKDQVIGAVKGVLNLLLKLTFDTEVDGRLCFCSTDLCAAGGCAKGTVGVLGYCVDWYYFLAAGLAVLLLTCCCCCCCCCRKKRKQNPTILAPPPTHTTVIYQADGVNGVGGFTNPMSSPLVAVK